MNSHITRVLIYGLRHERVGAIRFGFSKSLLSSAFPSTSADSVRFYAYEPKNSPFKNQAGQTNSHPRNDPLDQFQRGQEEEHRKKFDINTLVGIVVGVVLYAGFEFITNYIKAVETAPKPPDVINKDWEKDVVYLYQFPRPKDSPNYSPFCLKVEAFLRLHNIKYEIIEATFIKSVEGLLPFIELNGEHFADSQLILMKLKEHFKISEPSLKPEQQAVARALERICDNGIFSAGNYLKFKGHMNEWSEAFLKTLVSDFWASQLKHHMAMWMTHKVDARLLTESTARHTRDDIEKILRKDLEVIDTILGSKPFLFGKEPTTPDATLFAHLAAIYYLPFVHEVQDILDEEFPKIKAHMERMKERLFKEVNTENSSKESQKNKHGF